MSVCEYCKKILEHELHIKNGFHSSCRNKKNSGLTAKAIQNTQARRAPNATFVQGGSTGLVQQRGAGRRPPSSHQPTGIKKSIKDECKMHQHDLVLMQMGTTFDVIEEDAEYFKKNYKFKYARNVTSYHSTGFSVHAIKRYKEELLQSGLCFCIVEEIEPENGRHMRKLTFSSCNPQSEGLTFPGGLISN